MIFLIVKDMTFLPFLIKMCERHYLLGLGCGFLGQGSSHPPDRRGCYLYIYTYKGKGRLQKGYHFFKIIPFSSLFFERRAFTAISLNHIKTTKTLFYWGFMAERQGFEPWEPVKAQRFSRTSIQLSRVSVVAENHANKGQDVSVVSGVNSSFEKIIPFLSLFFV